MTKRQSEQIQTHLRKCLSVFNVYENIRKAESQNSMSRCSSASESVIFHTETPQTVSSVHTMATYYTYKIYISFYLWEKIQYLLTGNAFYVLLDNLAKHPPAKQLSNYYNMKCLLFCFCLIAFPSW